MNSWEKIKEFVKKEIVLCAAVVLAAVSSLYYTPKASYIDWDVLFILLALMLVVAGLKGVRFLDWAAIELLNRCASWRQVVLSLVLLTYASSMFVTNDVALITFVPLALVIGRTLKKDVVRLVILQTLAANLGSMVTPPGNPQNLFLYAHYGYSAGDFFGVMALPGLLSLTFIMVLIYRDRDQQLTLELPALPQPNKRLTAMYLLLLALNIGAVLHFLGKAEALAVTAVLVTVVNRSLWRLVDYSLLVTFIGFFIFIGNIGSSPLAQLLQSTVLGTAAGTYIAGLAASQVLSNVPAAMLLAGLTQEADALLLGVNIGGLGTLIASMASVISYKLFAAEHPYLAGTYLKTFSYYNGAGLVLLGGIVYFLL